MADPALGTNAVVAIDFEASWGVAKGTPVGKKIAVVSCGIVPAQELLDNPTIRGDFNSSDPASGRKSASGQIVMIPNITVNPWLHKWLTGNLTVTGASDPYTNSSKIAADVAKSCVVEVDYDIGGTHRYARASGVRINRWGIPINFEGFLQYSLDCLGKDVTIETSAYDATLAPDWSAGSPLDMMQLASADVKLGGSAVGYINSGNIDIAANLFADDYRVGAAGARGSLVPQRHQVTGSLKLVVDSTAVLTLITGSAATSLSFKWTNAANRTFQLDLPRVFLQKTGPALQDGPIMVDVSFRAAYDTGEGTMCKFTTINDQDGATVYV